MLSETTDKFAVPIITVMIGWGTWVTRKCFLAGEAMERVARIEAKLDKLIEMHMDNGKKPVLQNRKK